MESWFIVFALHSGSVHPDNCNCPKFDAAAWQKKAGCYFDKLPAQIEQDLRPFPPKSVDFEDVLKGVKGKFGVHPGSYSFCHYAVVNNEVTKSYVCLPFLHFSFTPKCKNFGCRFIANVMDSILDFISFLTLYSCHLSEKCTCQMWNLL